jgi:hypothetical protein
VANAECYKIHDKIILNKQREIKMILIAEDEFQIREAYQELLDPHGYEVKVFLMALKF